MLMQVDVGKPDTAHVIVLGNEKGGSGKSTTAMHVAIALMQAGQRVATIDLDSRQRSFTRYVENRRDWGERARVKLVLPKHYCVARGKGARIDEVETQEFSAFAEAVTEAESTHDFIVIDTPGSDSYLMRLAHSMADTLITPLNDSFVDFDVLGSVDPTTFEVDRRQPLRRDGARGPPAAAAGRRRIDRLGGAAQPALGARIAQQAAGRRGRRQACRATRLSLGRWLYRTGNLPRILSARSNRARRDLASDTLGLRPSFSHVSARDEVKAPDGGAEAAARPARQTPRRGARRMDRVGRQAA